MSMVNRWSNSLIFSEPHHCPASNLQHTKGHLHEASRIVGAHRLSHGNNLDDWHLRSIYEKWGYPPTPADGKGERVRAESFFEASSSSSSRNKQVLAPKQHQPCGCVFMQWQQQQPIFCKFFVLFLGFQTWRSRVFGWDSRIRSSFRAMMFPRPAGLCGCQDFVVELFWGHGSWQQQSTLDGLEIGFDF